MALTVFSGTTHDVDDTTEIGDLVLSGGTLDVASAGSGGTIEDTTVSGTDNIYSGGSAVSSFVTGVWSSGGAGSVFINGGDENVLSGGVADGTSVTGVSSGGSSFFGIQEIYGIASGTVVLSLGLDAVYSGGSALGTTVSSGGNEFIESGGYASGAIVDGGVQAVEEHGSAVGTIVNSGHQLVAGSGGPEPYSFDTFHRSVYFSAADCGVAFGTTVNGGDLLVAGVSVSGIINSHGLEVLERSVSSGPTDLASLFDTLNGGVQVVFGNGENLTALGTMVNGGGIMVAWGSGAQCDYCTVNSGSFDFAVYGGEVAGARINSGGTEFVESGGFAELSLMYGGTEVVANGGSTLGILVTSGGLQVVDSGGDADVTSITSGGTMFVESGGSARYAYVIGGQDYLYGGYAYSGHLYYGTEYVEAGGSSVNTVLVDQRSDLGGTAANQVVGSGGVAEDTLVAVVSTGYSGGVINFDIPNATQVISASGESIGTSVFSGGREIVGSGGSAVSTYIYSAGTMEIASGGSVGSSGTVYFASAAGTLQLDDSQHFSGQISGFDAYAGSGSASEATNYLDLRDILYGPSTNVSFVEANNSESGTLTVTDGTHTANLVLLGDFVTGDFKKESDGFGGTDVYDPANSAQLGTVVAPTHS
jgi:autotransporter passenger strand-loop-strand repeat protein